jgi:hypothetical protein
MRNACERIVNNIQKLDYIAAHYLEEDKVYRDILEDLESSLCTLEASVGEMRSDESIEDKDAKYRVLLSEKEQEKCKRLYLAEHIKTINGILKGVSDAIGDIPEKILMEK